MHIHTGHKQSWLSSTFNVHAAFRYLSIWKISAFDHHMVVQTNPTFTRLDHVTDAMRRSTRTKRLRTSYDDESDTPVYPEAPPSNALEKLVACLNQQTFPMASYGKIDDLVVTSLFASKRCHRYYRAMKPPSFQERWDSLLEEGNSDHSADVDGDELTQPARDADGDESALLIPSEPSFTAIHALFICKMFNKNVPPGTMPQSQTVKEVCQAVIKEMPQFFPDADMEIMEQ